MPIDAQHATIKTVTVEIRALVLGNKQVTLAVFRQLPKDQVINRYTGEIIGEPWGTVNYHDATCLSLKERRFHLEPSHIHVIAEYDGKLFHDRVGVDEYTPEREDTKEERAIAQSLFWKHYRRLQNLPQLFIAV